MQSNSASLSTPYQQPKLAPEGTQEAAPDRLDMNFEGWESSIQRNDSNSAGQGERGGGEWLSVEVGERQGTECRASKHPLRTRGRYGNDRIWS